MVKELFPGLMVGFSKKGLPARRRFENDNARVVSIVVKDEVTGERRGTCTLRMESRPCRHVKIIYLNVEPSFRKLSTAATSGVGGTILRQLNQQLMERGLFAVVYNKAPLKNFDVPEVATLYSAHDWEYFQEGKPFMYYKATKNVLSSKEFDRIKSFYLS